MADLRRLLDPWINGKEQPSGVGIPIHTAPADTRTTMTSMMLLYAAGQMLKTSRARPGRKMIFLISDGSDSAATMNTVSRKPYALLLAADVSLYSISVSHSLPIGRSLLQRGASEIGRYADRTGGDTFVASKQQDLERLYSEVTEQARNEYTLTFAPQGADPEPRLSSHRGARPAPGTERSHADGLLSERHEHRTLAREMRFVKRNSRPGVSSSLRPSTTSHE